MNRVYKSIWNAVRQTYVAVSEKVSCLQSVAKTVTILLVGSLLASGATPLQAEVISNSASLSGSRNFDTLEVAGGTKTVQLQERVSPMYNFLANLRTGSWYLDHLPYAVSYEPVTSYDEWYLSVNESYSYGDNTWYDSSEVTNPILPSTHALCFWNYNCARKSEVEAWLATNYVPAQLGAITGNDVHVTAGANITINKLQLGNTQVKGTQTVKWAQFTEHDHQNGGSDNGPGDSHWTGARYSSTVEGVKQAPNTFYNDGGSLSINSLVFSSSDNQFIHNGGTTHIGNYVGGGQINLNGGTVSLDRMTSDATITANGGVLDAKTIDLSSPSVTATNTQLKTYANQIADFDKSIATIAGLMMNDSDKEVTLNASIINRTETLKGMKSSFKNNVNWSGGSFHFKGEYTQSSSEAIKSLVQTNYGSVPVTFDKIVNDYTPTDVSQGLTATVVNSIFEENGTSDGVIFYQHQLDARSMPITIGNIANATTIANNVGFKSINGSQKVTVLPNRALVLVGEDSTTLLSTGQIEVLAGGSLRLGTSNQSIPVGGQLQNISVQGDVTVQRGQYQINTLAGEGTIQIAPDAHIILFNGNFAGTITNNGNAEIKSNGYYGSLSGLGTTQVALSNNVRFGALQNVGSLKVLDSKVTLDSNISNQSADEIIVNGANAKVNLASGTLNTKVMQLDNASVSIAELGSLSIEQLSLENATEIVNNGALHLARAVTTPSSATIQLTNNGSLTANSDLNLNGRFVNNGRSTLLGTTTIKGTLQNSVDSHIEANTVTVSGTLRNYGTMEVSDDSSVDGLLENTGIIKLYDTAVGNRGEINNTVTLEGTGVTEISGLLSNAQGAEARFQGENANMVVKSGGRVINNGMLIADRQTIEAGGEFINGQTVTAAPNRMSRRIRRATNRPTEYIGTLNVAENGSKTNNEAGVYGQGTIAGTYVNASGAEAYAGKGDTFTEGTGLEVTSTGAIHNAGTFTFAGALSNAGTIDGQGTVNLAKVDGATNAFTNSGTITTGTLNAQGITYNQTAGKLTANNGWFENATVNLTGGALNHATLGSGNTYNLGDSSSGNNTATLTVDTLTSDSVVNINRGATLRAPTIAMTGNKTTRLIGGRLSTQLDQVFAEISYSALNLEAKNPNDIVIVESDPPIVTGVGQVIDSVKQGIQFAWGTIAFDDAQYSALTASDILTKLTAIGDTPAEHSNQLEVVFNGRAAEYFTVDLANTVSARLPSGLPAYATFTKETLTNITLSKADTPSLVLGETLPRNNETSNLLMQSMGFMNIAKADEVFIEYGKKLVLVGTPVDHLPNDSYSSDTHKLLLDSINGGSVTVNNGNFTFGSDGSSTPTVGWINESAIGENGHLEAKNGEFADWTITNDGEVKVASNAILHTNHYSGSGNGTNEGKLVFEEKDAVKPTFEVAGSFTNKGENAKLDAMAVETTLVSGTMTNEGTANYDDMTIQNGGQSNNSGYEKGDILTLASGATHTNTGTSIWNNQMVNEGSEATNEVTGKETFTGEYVVNGTKTNKGEVDATGVENTTVAGTLNNEGKSLYDDMTIQNGGQSNNSGYEKGDILTVETRGSHNNSGTSIWNNVVVSGGDMNNSGSVNTDTLTLTDGTLKLDGGNLVADKTKLDGGDLVIGNDKPLAFDNRVSAEINPSDDVIDTNIYVKNNGELNLGPKGGLEWADSIGSPKIPDTPSRLIVTTNVTTGEGGGIAVGKDVWTDKDHHVQIGNGDLYFAHDSVTVVDASILSGDKSAFSTTSDKAKVTVEKGATLALAGIQEVGNYTLTQGFDTSVNSADGTWDGGWTGSTLYGLSSDASGLNWVLTLHHDPHKIWVFAKMEDVRNVYDNIAIPNIANDNLLHCKSGEAGDNFVCSILRDQHLSKSDKEKILNSVANIAFAGGAMAVSMNDMNSAADSLENRMSMKGDAFTSQGFMKGIDFGNTWWLDVIGSKQSYKSLSATGIKSAGFETDALGFVMGYDHKLNNRPVILGGAISANRGDLKSNGDVLDTTNKYTSYGLHAYGAWSPSPKLNVIGTLSYMHNASDIEQTINAAGFRKAEADVSTDMLAVGVRAETHLKLGKATVVPHAGLRVVHAKSGNYDTKVDGKKIWDTSSDAVTTVQMPVGVAVRGDMLTQSGWSLRPHADLTFTPNFGDTKVSSTIKNSRHVTDAVEGNFTGKFGTSLNLGLQAEKSTLTMGVNYGYTTSDKGRSDHTVKFEVRKMF